MTDNPSTPQRHSSPLDSTPLRRTTHVSDGALHRTRESTMQLANLELAWNIFRDPGLLDHVFSVDAADVDKVLTKVLSGFHLGEPTWNIGKKRVNWDLQHAAENYWYGPLVWLQNHIISSIRGTIGCDPACIFGDLKFCAWDRPLKEGNLSKNLGNAHELKPDIIDHSPGASEVGLSWTNVRFVEEVKDRLHEAIVQVSTYVRCLFVAQEHWFCVPTLVFQYIRAEYYFLLHTRSGIIATPPMCLRTEEGLREIVKMFICLTRWTPEKALNDTSRSQNWFSFEGLGDFRVNETICRRTNLIGPSTRVHTLVKDAKEMVGTSESEEAEPAEREREAPRIRSRGDKVEIESGTKYRPVNARRSTRLALKAQAKQAALHSSPAPRRSTPLAIRSHARQRAPHSVPVDASEGSATEQEISIVEAGMSKFQLTPAREWETLKPGEWSLIPRVDHGVQLHPLHIPDLSENERPCEFAYKISTPLATRCVEGEMFIPLHDEWGVPNIIAGLEVKTQKGEVIETKAFCSSKAEFWDILLSAQEKRHQSPSIFLNRRLYALLMSTVGRPLTAAPTIIHLLEGVLHAMLGHYVLYRSGWLHRDVSTGNVLLLKNPEPRKQEIIKEVLEPEIKLGDCRGMIVDGDHAIKWKESREDPGDTRSGTLPFLSVRLLETWLQEQSCLHTAIDDLESFFWVSLASIFECRLMRGISSKYIDSLYQMFYGFQLTGIVTTKSHIVKTIRRVTLQHPSTTAAFNSVIGLLGEWHLLSETYAERLDAPSMTESVDAYDALCEEAYKAYFRAGFRKLEELKADPTKHDKW